MRIPPLPSSSNETDESKQATIDLGKRILLHAQVYSFANEYLVWDLESYSLDCMQACFKEEKVSPGILPYLLKTIEQIYENTPSSPTMENRAREAVCAFVAQNYFILVPDNAVHALSSANGCFLAELSHKIAQIALEKTSETRTLQVKLQESNRRIKALTESTVKPTPFGTFSGRTSQPQNSPFTMAPTAFTMGNTRV